mgnify:CR=1 FL=1
MDVCVELDFFSLAAARFPILESEHKNNGAVMENKGDPGAKVLGNFPLCVPSSVCSAVHAHVCVCLDKAA